MKQTFRIDIQNLTPPKVEEQAIKTAIAEFLLMDEEDVDVEEVFE